MSIQFFMYGGDIDSFKGSSRAITRVIPNSEFRDYVEIIVEDGRISIVRFEPRKEFLAFGEGTDNVHNVENVVAVGSGVQYSVEVPVELSAKEESEELLPKGLDDLLATVRSTLLNSREAKFEEYEPDFVLIGSSRMLKMDAQLETTSGDVPCFKGIITYSADLKPMVYKAGYI